MKGQEEKAEWNNIAEKKPKKVEELLETLKTWQAKVQAPIPTELNPDYISVK